MLVTAILPTRARPEMVWDALACILRQAWRELEILILDDSEQPSFAVAPKTEHCLTYRALKASSLGAKLNIGCSLAKGEYIVRFDDDDSYAPGRISDQVERLIESGKAVTSYRDIRFTDGQRTWINRNWPSGNGASLSFRKGWWQEHPFPDISLGEDWAFATEAMRANEFIAGACGDFMVASIHPGNISPRAIGEGWEEIAQQS